MTILILGFFIAKVKEFFNVRMIWVQMPDKRVDFRKFNSVSFKF